MFELIDGKRVSASERQKIKNEAELFLRKNKRAAGLAVVLVGENPASQVYVRNKIKACEETGIKSFAYYLPENVRQNELEDLIKALAKDDSIDGILVQLPLPKGLDQESALKLIPVEKDVDGFSAENIGRLSLNSESLVACTPNGIMKLLENYNIDPCGKRAVIVGRSNIVGKPMALLLINANATVTVCHSKTVNLKEICQTADILIAAVGKAKFITEDMVKSGAVVIDVGMNRNEEGKLCGDVDFENVKDKCAFITPVPGGVGPMTITMLLHNTMLAAERRCN